MMNSLFDYFTSFFLKNNKKSVNKLTEYLVDFFNIFWFYGDVLSSVFYFNVVPINGVYFT